MLYQDVETAMLLESNGRMPERIPAHQHSILSHNGQDRQERNQGTLFFYKGDINGLLHKTDPMQTISEVQKPHIGC